MFKCCWNIYRNSPCSSGVYPNRKYTLLATQSTLEPNALSSNYSSVEFVVFLQVFNRHRLVPNSEAKRRGIEKRNSRPFHLTNETENTSFDSILVRDRKVFFVCLARGANRPNRPNRKARKFERKRSWWKRYVQNIRYHYFHLRPHSNVILYWERFKEWENWSVFEKKMPFCRRLAFCMHKIPHDMETHNAPQRWTNRNFFLKFSGHHWSFYYLFCIITIPTVQNRQNFLHRKNNENMCSWFTHFHNFFCSEIFFAWQDMIWYTFMVCIRTKNHKQSRFVPWQWFKKPAYKKPNSFKCMRVFSLFSIIY